MKQRAEPGWKVVGSKGKYIGTVEHVREDHLIVAQGRIFQHTLYIPVSHVASSGDGQVMLTLPASDADAQGWRFPPNAGFSHGEGDFWDNPVATAISASGTPGGFGTASGTPGQFHDNKIDPNDVPSPELQEDVATDPDDRPKED